MISYDVSPLSIRCSQIYFSCSSIVLKYAFTDYSFIMQARKGLRRLKGRVRLQNLTQNYSVKKQGTTTLSYLHAWSRIKSQIRDRRLCMVTEGRLKQKKLENQLKLEAKLHDLEVRVIRKVLLADQNIGSCML